MFVLVAGGKTKISLSRGVQARETGSFVSLGLITLVVVSGLPVGWLSVLPNAHAQGAATVSLSPSSIASLLDSPGTSVAIQVNVASSKSYGGFAVGIFFNSSVLQFTGLDYSNNVLGGGNALVDSECLDGHDVFGSGNLCNEDISYDGIGVVSLTMLTNSGLNTTTPNGKLFSVTFTVISTGFSTIHFVQHLFAAACFSTCPNIIDSVGYDGYFTNMECPSGSSVLCQPPVVGLISPQNAVVGNPVNFDGSASKSQNLNGMITQYFWVWRNGANQVYQTTTSPTTIHVFSYSGPWKVSLTVRDNYGAIAIETLPIEVVVNPLQIKVSIFFTDQNLNPLPEANTHSLTGPFVTMNFVDGSRIVKKVTPAHILAWFNITNSGDAPIQSLILNETLELWTVISQKPLSSVKVYLANTTSLRTNPEVTRPLKVTVSFPPYWNPFEWVQVVLPNLAATEIGHPLMPGETLLVSVKLDNAIVGTEQSRALPEFDLSVADAYAWVGARFTGIICTGMDVSGIVLLPEIRGNVARQSPEIV